jgi:hypothetical protein
MVELLTTLSLTQIIIIGFLILVAVKEVLSIWEFFHKKIKGAFNQEASEKELIETIHNKAMKLETELREQRARDIAFNEKLQFLEEDAKQRKAFDMERHNQNLEFQKECTERLNKQQEILTLLTESDRDDIKSWIVQQYHHFYEEQGWIDDFSMDSLEKRYACYQQEGGNSYITGMVKQLRTLPRQPRK